MPVTATKESTTTPPLRFASEDEFEAWCDEDTRAEYVDGEVIIMTPESIAHARQETWLGTLLELFVSKSGLGSVISTGMTQVRLRSGLRRNPDVIFVEKSKSHRMRATYIDGAPDLVVEFVSPDSAIRDWHEKYIEYEAAGVREYWIVDREQEKVAAYSLGEDRRYHPIALEDDKLHSQVLPGFWIKREWFWRAPGFDTYEMAKEIGIIG